MRISPVSIGGALPSLDKIGAGKLDTTSLEKTGLSFTQTMQNATAQADAKLQTSESFGAELAAADPDAATEVGIGTGSPATGSFPNSGVSFKDSIKDAVSQVNDLQKTADTFATQLATGDLEDIHKAMIAMQKAKLAFDFTVQVRNKVIEAYQEIMRMQV